MRAKRLRINPRDWKAMSMLGVNLLRIGEEERARRSREGIRGRSIQRLDVNTLTLLDSFENFEHFETPHFKVMLHKKEAAALRPYVTELLEKAYKDLPRNTASSRKVRSRLRCIPTMRISRFGRSACPGSALWVSVSENSS